MKNYIKILALCFASFRLGDEIAWVTFQEGVIIPFGPITDMIVVILFVGLYSLIEKYEKK